jgi:hypothetical protein
MLALGRAGKKGGKKEEGLIGDLFKSFVILLFNLQKVVSIVSATTLKNHQITWGTQRPVFSISAPPPFSTASTK